MNDDEIKTYKQAVIDFVDDNEDIDNVENEELSEAEVMLRKIRGGGTSIKSGGFSGGSESSRSLTASNNIDYKNGAPSDEDIVNSVLENLQNKFSENEEKQLDLSKFADLKGLTKPLATPLKNQYGDVSKISHMTLFEDLQNLWK
jgi:hypothetical protein